MVLTKIIESWVMHNHATAQAGGAQEMNGYLEWVTPTRRQ